MLSSILFWDGKELMLRPELDNTEGVIGVCNAITWGYSMAITRWEHFKG